MLRVGLTGGIATGKTFVARTFVALGCHVIQADELGHQVLEPDGPAFTPVVAAFGSQILTDGRIDRKALAHEVFANPIQLEKLNSIVHPLVIKCEDRRMAELEAISPNSIVVVEAAIMIEMDLHRRYQKLVLTVCTPQQQLKRAMERGLTKEEATARLERQMPLEEKQKYADYIIDTSGTREQTVEQASAVFKSLRSLIQ